MSQPVYGGPARRGSLVLGLVLGVVVGLVLLGGTWALLGGGSRGVPAPTKSPSASATGTRTPSPTRSASPTSTPSPSPTATPTSSLGEAVTQLPSGTLFTVLESLPKVTTTLDAAFLRAAEFQAGHASQVIVVDTDAFPVFRPGYWAVGVAGATTRDESVAICNEFGVPRGDRCYSRQIP